MAPPSPHLDPDRLFQTAHLQDDLQRRSVKGGSAVLLSQGCIFFLGVASMMVLARLLKPGDFGILAMAGTLTAFVFSIREFGLGMAIIQNADTNHARATHLFWLNLKLNLIVTLFMLGMTPVLVWFYGQDELIWVIPVLALALYFNSVWNTHRALLRRQMHFGRLAAIELTAQILGIVSALAGAVGGLGLWSLVLQQVVVYLIEGIGFVSMARWMPGRHRDRAGRKDDTVRGMLDYSRHYTWARVIEYAGGYAQQIVVGRMAGATTLGLYSKAFQWSVQPVRQLLLPLQQVVLAGSSRLVADPPRYQAYFRKGLMMTFTIILPVQAFLFAAGRDFILVLLGEQWVDAIPLFRLLILGSFVGSAGYLTRWIYLSEGRSRDQLQWMQFATPFHIAAAVVGAQWGAVGVAAAVACSQALLTPPGVYHCLKRSPITMATYFGAAAKPALLSMVAAAVVLGVDEMWLEYRPLLVRCTWSAITFTLAYLGGWMLIPGGRRDLCALWQIAGSLRR